MDIQNFESQYRESMAETLDELQTAMLLIIQAQRKISKIGNSVAILSRNVETFIQEQKN